MDIIKTFNTLSSQADNKENGIYLAPINENIYIGLENRDILFIARAAEPMKNTIMQRTKKLLLQCTVSVALIGNESKETGIVHIIRCCNVQAKEKDVFLRLCEVMFGLENYPLKEDRIIDSFNVLSSFFSVQKALTNLELQGLYSELFTIWYFKDKFPLHLHWQSKEKMRFDFSFTKKMKLEVKSTQKPERKHHFKHEQLTTEINDIFVLSYLLQQDDSGKSLYELIISCKELMMDTPEKIVYLEKILFDIPVESLDSLRFHQGYMIQNMKLFNAKDIPKFTEETPDGVTNVEYDCVLNNLIELPIEEFFSELNCVIHEEESLNV